MLADMAQARLPPEIIELPVRVDILAVVHRPKNRMKKKDPDGCVWTAAKPDEDNIRKSVKDALKTFWRDDAQVVGGETWKMYAEKDGRPRVYVFLTTELPREADVLARFAALVSH